MSNRPDPTEFLRNFALADFDQMNTEMANLLIERIRWAGTPKCGCGARLDVVGENKTGWYRYKCRACRAQMTAKTGTTYYHYTASPQAWLFAVCAARYRYPSMSAATVQNKTGVFHEVSNRARELFAAGLRPKDEPSRAEAFTKEDLTKARNQVARVLAVHGTRLRRSQVFALTGDSPAHRLAYGDLANLTRTQILNRYPQEAR